MSGSRPTADVEAILTAALREAGAPDPNDYMFLVRLHEDGSASVTPVHEDVCKKLKFVSSFQVTDKKDQLHQVLVDKPEKPCKGPLNDTQVDSLRRRLESWRLEPKVILCAEGYLALGCVYAWAGDAGKAEKIWKYGKKAPVQTNKNTKGMLEDNLEVVHEGDPSGYLTAWRPLVQSALMKYPDLIRDAGGPRIWMID